MNNPVIENIHSRYPTHFGQMECLKLIASPKFHEKRVCVFLISTIILFLGWIFGPDPIVRREHRDSDARD